MSQTLSFGLNQIILPESRFEDFIDLLVKSGVSNLEIRNDLPIKMIDPKNTEFIREIVKSRDMKILSINALQKFNLWSKEREQELMEMCKFASESEIEGIVLVPLNDGTIVDNKTQKELLQSSLKSIINILDDYNLM